MVKKTKDKKVTIHDITTVLILIVSTYFFISTVSRGGFPIIKGLIKLYITGLKITLLFSIIGIIISLFFIFLFLYYKDKIIKGNTLWERINIYLYGTILFLPLIVLVGGGQNNVQTSDFLSGIFIVPTVIIVIRYLLFSKSEYYEIYENTLFGLYTFTLLFGLIKNIDMVTSLLSFIPNLIIVSFTGLPFIILIFVSLDYLMEKFIEKFQ